MTEENKKDLFAIDFSRVASLHYQQSTNTLTVVFDNGKWIYSMGFRNFTREDAQTLIEEWSKEKIEKFRKSTNFSIPEEEKKLFLAEFSKLGSPPKKDLTSQAHEEPKSKNDPVNHPSHYNKHPLGIECKDVIWVVPGCFTSQAMKYLWRYRYKGKPVEDLEKAIWYLKEEVQKMMTHPKLDPAEWLTKHPENRDIDDVTKGMSNNISMAFECIFHAFEYGHNKPLLEAVECIEREIEELKEAEKNLF